MKELSPLRCMRCEGEWVPKVENPRQCPLCKSPFWNTPYRRGPKKPPVSVPKLEHYIKDTAESVNFPAQFQDATIANVSSDSGIEAEHAKAALDVIWDDPKIPLKRGFAVNDVDPLIVDDGKSPLSYAEQVKLAIERMRK